MLPSIALTHSIEMLRDGGSFCASFQGANGSHYWLVLPVILEGSHVKGYAQPVLLERPYAPEEWQVSWPHAKSILHQVESLLRETQSRQYVARMYEIIDSEGSIR